MGHPSFPFDLRLPPPAGRGSLLCILVDYRPILEQVDTLRLRLGPPWGSPEQLHAFLTEQCRLGRSFTLVDVEGEEWMFHHETVKAFYVKSP